jgi:N-formylglutamate deformylase
MVDLFKLTQGSAPLLISMPHPGTFIPHELAARLSQPALRLPDTDWHMERLYDFATALGASTLVATHSRYVIDLNRPPDDASLYPGQDTTALCPIDTFDREPLYLGGPPHAIEIESRVARYWQPYHAALQAELDRMRSSHGSVVLWDAHSIRSVVPRFFQGRLADLNVGSAQGKSCDRSIVQRVMQVAQKHPQYTSVLDGRFKGGYITRHYGRPDAGVHAVQLELAQLTYMEEAYPFTFDEQRASELQVVLREMLETLIDHRS